MHYEIDLLVKHRLESKKNDILNSESLFRKMHRFNLLRAVKLGEDKQVVCVAETEVGKVVIRDSDIEHQCTQKMKLVYEDIMDELVQEI